MSWEKKYYFTFRDINNRKYTVEIHEDIDSPPLPVPAEIRGDSRPVLLRYNSARFSPVAASVASLMLLSETDRQFFSLYTKDMMKYQVRIYYEYTISPGVTTDLPVWFGFLDSENYSEPFYMLDNYPVEVTANDGFNLLNRIRYAEYNPLNNSWSKYSGVNSLWTIFLRIIQKLNLPWENIYVGLSTTPLEGTLPANETILHHLYANNENYYNEDDEPESCRKVLDEILRPLGATLIQSGGDLYILDTHSILSGSVSCKKYEYAYEATSYLTTVSLNFNQGEISTIGVESSNLTLEVEPGVNKQILLYNHYSLDKIIDYKAEGDFSGAGTVTNYGDAGYSWDETEYSTSEKWDKYNNGMFCAMQGAEETNDDQRATYLKIENYGLTGLQPYSQLGDETKHSFSYKLPLPYSIQTSNYYLRIDMQAYIRTLDNLGDEPTLGVKAAFLTCRLKIGSKKYTAGWFFQNSSYANWVDDTNTQDLILMFRNNQDSYNNVPINDMWISLDKKYLIGFYQDGQYKETTESRPYLIPLAGTQGTIEFDIYGYRVYDESEGVWTEIEVPDFRIKNLKLSITDKDGNEVDLSDIEYQSDLDAKFANEGPKVTLLHGTNINYYPVQRGNLLISASGNYSPCTGLNRASDTDIVENLLLRTIKSNIGVSNVKLTCTLPCLFAPGYYTYAAYLSGKKLLVIDNQINLEEATSDVRLLESHTDTAVIE